MKLRHISVPASLLFLSLLPTPASASPGASGASTPTQCTPAGTPSVDLLSLDVESLLNMKVVTASKFSQAVSDAPGVITVVSQDELQRFGGITLAEILGRVPGMQATTAYFTDRSIVAARGDQTKINGGHILFLINGRPSREVLEGGLVSDLLESFPVSVLERIEIVKGPGSVLYGSNAFSAVINLITRKADRNGFSFAALPGAAGALATSGEGTFSCGSFSLVGGAHVHQRADWNTPYRFAVTDDPLAPSVPALQNVTIRDQSRGAFVQMSYKNLSVMSSFTDWQTSSFVRGSVGEDTWKRGFADVGYGDRFRGTFPSLDPPLFARVQFGVTGTASVQKSLTQPISRNEAVADFSVEYGLPGKPGYTYHRPFDYFDLQFTSSTGSRFENMFTRGLLAGRAYGEHADRSRGIWGLYGSYDYVAPQIFRVSSVALSLGTTVQRKVAESSAIQGTFLAGVGYAAGGGLGTVDETDYHYGVTPQVLAAVRFIPGDRAAVDMTFRDYYVSPYASNNRGGSENIARIDALLSIRIASHHAGSVRYIWSRRATYGSDPVLGNVVQSRGSVGLFYTYFVGGRFGAIEY